MFAVVLCWFHILNLFWCPNVMGFFSQSTGSTGLFKKKNPDGDHDDLTDICPMYALIYCRKKILLTWNHACNIPKEAIKMGVFLSSVHCTCFIMFIYIYINIFICIIIGQTTGLIGCLDGFCDSYIISVVLWYAMYSLCSSSEWLLFNANSAILQLYHGENKLILNEMMMRSVLY